MSVANGLKCSWKCLMNSICWENSQGRHRAFLNQECCYQFCLFAVRVHTWRKIGSDIAGNVSDVVWCVTSNNRGVSDVQHLKLNVLDMARLHLCEWSGLPPEKSRHVNGKAHRITNSIAEIVQQVPVYQLLARRYHEKAQASRAQTHQMRRNMKRSLGFISKPTIMPWLIR